LASQCNFSSPFLNLVTNSNLLDLLNATSAATCIKSIPSGRSIIAPHTFWTGNTPNIRQWVADNMVVICQAGISCITFNSNQILGFPNTIDGNKELFRSYNVYTAYATDPLNDFKTRGFSAFFTVPTSTSLGFIKNIPDDDITYGEILTISSNNTLSMHYTYIDTGPPQVDDDGNQIGPGVNRTPVEADQSVTYNIAGATYKSGNNMIIHVDCTGNLGFFSCTNGASSNRIGGVIEINLVSRTIYGGYFSAFE
jgi:hypothetical protein